MFGPYFFMASNLGLVSALIGEPCLLEESVTLSD